MKKFKLFGGIEIPNLEEYVIEYLRKFPECKLIVGTDSEQYNNCTSYVTVICFIKPRKGVHLIYRKEKVKKIKDIFSRLWNEIEYSRLIADELKDFLIDRNIIVHIDINNNKKEKSSMVHDSAVGYLKGLGYIVESKPNSWVASKAADWLC
jgi:predicted RNase H-related nuclease YkuK (DUF458 family)